MKIIRNAISSILVFGLLISVSFAEGESLIVTPAGKVGIGTSEPVADLEVAGEIKAQKLTVAVIEIEGGGPVIMSGQIGSFTTPTGPTNVPFDDFWVDMGGIVYDTSTRRFTVPKDGVYRINFNPMFSKTTSGCWVRIGINEDAPSGVSHKGSAHRQNAEYETGTLNSIVRLVSGDYVVFRLVAGKLHNTGTGKYGQFSIQKIAD